MSLEAIFTRRNPAMQNTPAAASEPKAETHKTEQNMLEQEANEAIAVLTGAESAEKNAEREMRVKKMLTVNVPNGELYVSTEIAKVILSDPDRFYGAFVCNYNDQMWHLKIAPQDQEYKLGWELKNHRYLFDTHGDTWEPMDYKDMAGWARLHGHTPDKQDDGHDNQRGNTDDKDEEADASEDTGKQEGQYLVNGMEPSVSEPNPINSG